MEPVRATPAPAAVAPVATAAVVQAPSDPEPPATPPALPQADADQITETEVKEPSDTNVHPTSATNDGAHDPAEAMPSLETPPGEPTAEIAARVGDTIITLRELKRAVRERLKPGTNWSELSHEQKNQLGRESLEYLIDRALIIQEARRMLSKPKQWDTFKNVANKMWEDAELATVMKRYAAQNEADLELRLKKLGQTVGELRDSFILDQMARMFTSEKLREQLEEPGLRDIYPYYREHLASYQRPAQITWREIFVGVSDTTDRIAAKAKAEALRSRVLGGEDFAAVARSDSESPRAKDGGLWETTPGGFGSADVNKVLDSLPIGGISEVIEDRTGLTIVRVDARREAGPAPFEEVQSKIVDALRGRQFEKAMENYMKDVRSRTAVSSPLFDGGESQPMQSSRRRVPVAEG